MSSAWEKAFELMKEGDAVLNGVILTTLEMAFTSSIIALLFGVLFGLIVANFNFPGKKVVITIMRAFMGFPPVVAGIFVFMLFSGTGPFGSLKLMYTVELMIIAQIILITPIVAGMTESALTPLINNMRPTMKGLELSRARSLGIVLCEGKFNFIAIYLFAFARAMSEVGAIQIVGGNILHKTRVMTTYIALNYSTGDFSMALALGIILLLIVLGVSCIASIIQHIGARNK